MALVWVTHPAPGAVLRDCGPCGACLAGSALASRRYRGPFPTLIAAAAAAGG